MGLIPRPAIFDQNIAALEKARYANVSLANHWPCGSSRPSVPFHFTSSLGRICGSSAEQKSHSRKEPHCECDSERRGQRPQEVVDPGRLDARRAIDLIDLVR